MLGEFHYTNTGVPNPNLKAYINLFIGYVQCFNCHNVANTSEFYLGQVRFNVTSTGNSLFQKELYNGIWNTIVQLFLKHSVE
jgi:hypothetical protein